MHQSRRLFGLEECEAGRRRLNRTISDMNNVTTVLLGIDSNLNQNSVVDCRRLGKFDPQSRRPRPMLVRMARTVDVIRVLSQKNKLNNSVWIRADLTKQERLTQ